MKTEDNDLNSKNQDSSAQDAEKKDAPASDTKEQLPVKNAAEISNEANPGLANESHASDPDIAPINSQEQQSINIPTENDKKIADEKAEALKAAEEAFAKLDINGDGVIDKNEIEKLVDTVSLPDTVDQVQKEA